MVSSGGAIVEGTSSSGPTFDSLDIGGFGNLQLLSAPFVGSITNPHSTNLLSFAQAGGITTSNVTLDNGSGTMTALQIIDSGLTATRLLASDGSKQLQSVTIANANGASSSFAGSTLTCSLSQDLQTTAGPTFESLALSKASGTPLLMLIRAGTNASRLQNVSGVGTRLKDDNSGVTLDLGASGIIPSGLTATRLLSSDANGALQSVTISNANGCNVSFTGATLTATMTQDLAVTATPTFACLLASNSVYFDGTSSTTIPTSTMTVLSYTTTTLADPGGMYDGTNKFTIGTTGVYQLIVFIRIGDQAAAANDSVGIQMLKNGATTTGDAYGVPDGAGHRTTMLQRILSLNATDYLQVRGWQASGVSLTANRVSVTISRIA